jgi:hypothetical protein
VQAGLDPCWSQTHYVGFVVTRLKYGLHLCVFYVRMKLAIWFGFAQAVKGKMMD